MAAAANDPRVRGASRAARWLLALPGSFASLTMITRTDS